MDQENFLKEQEKTKSELSFSLIESKAKEIFTAHEAACLWIELWDESPLATEYSLHCNDIKKARRLATLNNADGFTKYVVIRSAIDSKILANSGTFGTSTTIADWNKASDELKDRGCMRCLSSKDNLINTKLLKEIANSISEKPAFLFPNDSPPLTQCDLVIPRGLDQSVVDRLQVMIDAANHFWGSNGCANKDTKNSDIAGWIGKKEDVAPTMCEDMARITRPDYAKNKTWADNKRQD